MLGHSYACSHYVVINTQFTPSSSHQVLTVALTKLKQDTQMHFSTPAKPCLRYGDFSTWASQYHIMSPPNTSMPAVTYLFSLVSV